VWGFNQRLARHSYLIRLEPGVQLPEETLANRSGSCRDSAALLVQFDAPPRSRGAFRSGYLIQLVPDVKALDGPTGAKEDFTDLPCLVRGVPARCRWIGSTPPRDCWPAKVYSAGLHAEPSRGSARERRGGRVRNVV